MTAFKPSIAEPKGDRIVKWVRVPPCPPAHVIRRLSRMRDRPPTDVPRLLAFGLAGAMARLEFERVVGTPLWELVSTQSPEAVAVSVWGLSTVFRQLEAWRAEGFVHGDLSPRNILVAPGPRLWFIDWVLDLAGYEGTPFFASPEVRHGRRSWRSDRFAAERLRSTLGKRNALVPDIN